MELKVISGGMFKLDGGSMFGIVPKPLWEKICLPDDRNRINNDTNCLLIRKDSRLILVDTGYGDKLNPRDQDIYGISGPTILKSLAAVGIGASEIDLVILTHLHFDHAGGATQLDEEGRLVPTFPNAHYVVQKGEWEDALNEYGTMKNTYRSENYLPLMDRGLLTLLHGDTEIEPGIQVEVTGGHTRHHQLVKIETGTSQVVYAGDILPMTPHVRAPYNMAYDLFPYDTMMAKLRLLKQASDEAWIIVWDHDPEVSSGRIYCEGSGNYQFEALDI
tara:strand:+ start:94857 stop:95681 length:825 start_codon:yes stop_codon:yes gene_type:complete